MEITAEYFKERTGFEPSQDDLDRCNCKDAGRPGHHMCGWCEECDLPRSICGHLIRNSDIKKQRQYY